MSLTTNSDPPITTGPGSTVGAVLMPQDNPQNPTGDITMSPVGEAGAPGIGVMPTDTTTPQLPSQGIKPLTSVAPAAATGPAQPIKKGERGIGIIRAIAGALGGGPQNEIDPNTGEPVKTSTGALIARAIGRFGSSTLTGLANSRGPGGAFKAGAAAAQKQQEFSAEDQQRRYQSMEMFRAHARDIAALRHQNLGDTKLQQEIHETSNPWLESALNNGNVLVSENPMGETEAKNKFGDLFKQGYKPMLFFGPPRPVGDDPTKTEQTYFLVTAPTKDAQIMITPNEEAKDMLGKHLGVQIKDQELPGYVVANFMADKTAISTSIEKAQQELSAAKIEGVPRAQVDLGNIHEALIASQAMKEWQMIHSKYGDVAKDLQTFEAKHPGPGAAWISEHLYGGKEKEVSAALATQNMTHEQRVKYEHDQIALEKSKVDLQRARDEQANDLPKNEQEKLERGYRIEALKLDVASKQATADGKKPVPDPQGTSGEAYIAMLPPDMRQTVRDIGTGQIALSRYDYLIAKNPELMYAVANAYPGDFNTQRAAASIEEQKRFEGGGDVGKLINNIGAMAEHARTAYDIVSKNPGLSIGGQYTEAGKNYQGAVGALADEVASFLKGGGAPTDQEQRFWQQYLEPTAFWERRPAIKEVVNRMMGKYHEFESQWEKALPNPKMLAINPMPGISNEAIANLRYVANDGKSTVSVKAPNNKVYTFNTQEEADAFKKRAGIQ